MQESAYTLTVLSGGRGRSCVGHYYVPETRLVSASDFLLLEQNIGDPRMDVPLREKIPVLTTRMVGAFLRGNVL